LFQATKRQAGLTCCFALGHPGIQVFFGLMFKVKPQFSIHIRFNGAPPEQ
jgi:hypothetical protein